MVPGGWRSPLRCRSPLEFEVTKKRKVPPSKLVELFLFEFCGKEGIRTLEARLTLTRFPGGPLQPLEHLSVWLDDFSQLR